MNVDNTSHPGRPVPDELVPSRYALRVGIGGQRRGWQRKHPIADDQYINLADPQRVARRNQLVGHRSTGV